jgi:predicted TIM-barrel fold metal-dependent hydrolase
VNRRDALKAGVGGIGLAAQVAHSAGAGENARVVDTNVSLFQWPFRRLSADDPDALAKRLSSLGIAEAWAGSFEALLHRDLSAVNRRVSEVCARLPLFRPVGSLHPGQPGWREDLRRCAEEHGMRIVRLYPNYHGYGLDSSEFAELLALATKRRLLVQIAVAMEDERTQSAIARVPDADLSPLAALLRKAPAARVQLLNWRPRSGLLERLKGLPGLFFDTARVEGTDGIPRLVAAAGGDRVLFGSHAPFLIPESALIRTHESGQLRGASLSAVLGGNADKLFRKGRG